MGRHHNFRLRWCVVKKKLRNTDLSSSFGKLILIYYNLYLKSDLGSQKSPRSRRQRTTSMNQSSKKTSAESVLRTQHRTIYTAGRPPWYNTAGQQVEPFVIGRCK